MIPRVGEPIQKDQTYRLRPGAYAILPRKGKVLLTVDMAGGADIQLPGGGIDPGEHPFMALHREVREETGWKIRTPRRLGAFRRFTYMPEYDLWAEKLCTVYLARPVYQTEAPSEPDHHAIWLPVSDAIAALGNDGDRLFLSRFAQRYPL